MGVFSIHPSSNPSIRIHPYSFTDYTFFVAHEGAGMVKLQVAVNGTVISNAVIFEYKNASKRLEEELELSAELLTIVEESNSTTNSINLQENLSTVTPNTSTNTKQNSNPTIREPHNLYLCHDESCQRILKTMLLQKLDELILNLEDGHKRSPLTLQNRSPR